METINQRVTTIEDIEYQERKRTWGLALMKREKLDSPLSSYLEILKVWDKKYMKSKLEYKFVIINDEKKMFMQVSENDIFSVEKNPSKYLEDVKGYYEAMCEENHMKIDNPSLIIYTNKLTKDIEVEHKMIDFILNVSEIAPEYGFQLEDLIVVRPNEYLSYRENNVLDNPSLRA